MITKPHARPFTYPIIQEYAALGLDPNKIEALYLFDPASNVYEASGNQRHGALTGGAIYKGEGRYGICLFADGVDDYVRIPQFNSVGNSGAELSVSFWAKAKLVANKVLVSHNDFNAGVNQQSWSISTIGGKITFFATSVGNGATGKIWEGDDALLTTTEYNHFVCTFDGNGTGNGTAGDIKIYKNGVEASSYTILSNVATATLHASTADLTLSCSLDNDVASNLYNMVMDNCLIYSGVLNQSQISNICNKGL